LQLFISLFFKKSNNDSLFQIFVLIFLNEITCFMIKQSKMVTKISLSSLLLFKVCLFHMYGKCSKILLKLSNWKSFFAGIHLYFSTLYICDHYQPSTFAPVFLIAHINSNQMWKYPSSVHSCTFLNNSQYGKGPTVMREVKHFIVVDHI